ncbi:hypothetical protein ACFL6E_07420 [Candidatus Neomarinimicrobiota bacterium]
MMRFIVVSILTSLILCCDVTEPSRAFTESQIRAIVHGSWRDEENRIIRNTPSVIEDGTYGMDTTYDDYRVMIYWDDGTACDAEYAIIDENELTLVADGYNCTFTVLDSKHISVKFTPQSVSLDGIISKTYKRDLIKLGNRLWGCF